ncbi:MAG: 50S ribosomal protein L15 [bacterium]|nr:50S ribosomal protein L15 [bacterium]
MLKLHTLKPYKDSSKKRKKVGRGFGSGHGTFSGRGANGQKSRSGGSIPAGFEGGRMPLHRQLPKKRGFTSRRPIISVVRLDQIVAVFKDKSDINPKILVQKGLIKSSVLPVKIIGNGEVRKVFNLEKVLVSAPARDKIEKAGGTVNSQVDTVEHK